MNARFLQSCSAFISIASTKHVRKTLFSVTCSVGLGALAYANGFCTKVNASTLDCFVPFASISSDKWMSPPVTNINHLNKEKSYRAKMEKMCMEMQAALCRQLEAIDGKSTFLVDKWDRKAGGGGISCIMQDGAVFEKAGVNISVINGTLSIAAVKQMATRLKNIDPSKTYPFTACGISSVIHPRNPHAPTVHFNFRYFELDHGDGTQSWWYGGGTDLTPTFLEREDAVHFHQVLKNACDENASHYYPQYKKWCDDYFHIVHRNEKRGVGGIFFDDLNEPSQADCFKFVKSCAEAVLPAYLPIVKKRKDLPYSYDDRQWQLLRRGRYVEFNLVYDRGTKFGLATPEARIESILMSLPLYAKWTYNYDHTDDPRKVALMKVLKSPEDWVPIPETNVSHS